MSALFRKVCKLLRIASSRNLGVDRRLASRPKLQEIVVVRPDFCHHGTQSYPGVDKGDTAKISIAKTAVSGLESDRVQFSWLKAYCLAELFHHILCPHER